MKQPMINTGHKAKSLLGTTIPRVDFDPTNPSHLSAFCIFRNTGKWTIHFNGQYPYTVPRTIERKLLDHVLRDYQARVDSIAPRRKLNRD